MIDVREAIEHLKKGHAILFPADTGWLLGCDISNASSVKALCQQNGTTTSDPATILIPEIGMLQQYLEKVPEIAWDLVDFAEHPLTVVYSKGKNVPSEMLDEQKGLPIRLVKDGLAHQLLRRFGRGLATINATQADDSKEPQTADYVLEVLNMPIIPKPATIMRLELNGQIQFLRK